MLNPEYLNTLNPMQRQAVELGSVNSLILAGAGSGKTKVLTTRIAWLLANQAAWPSQILAVTFTNKAAREMRTRLESMVNFDIKNMWIGTFHGICHRILRLHAEEANLPKTFQIIDSSDQLSLIRRIMKDAGIDIETVDPKAKQAAINRFKESGLRAADVMSEDETTYGIYRAYEGRCQREGLVDFAELLLRCVELLEYNTVLRDHYAERFRYILIDEFQDTNVLQYRWIKALSRPGVDTNCVFCVGDDDQSIYAFRGANVGNMAEFVRDYGVSHIVKLEQNYRSTSHILDAANAVIGHNAERMGKNLWTDSGSGELIDLYYAADDRDEARTITQDIMSTRRAERLNYGDFAVLYRNNSQSRVVEQYLIANSIPYRIYGGLRFFDRAEVKDVTAYLRVMTNPDDTSLMRVINHPPRGIGNTTMERAAQIAHDLGVSLWDVINDANADKSIARTKTFVDLIESMREACEGLTLADMVKTVVKMSGLMTFYEAQKDQDIRLENLSELINAAKGYCEDNGIDESAPAMEPVPGAGMTPLEGFLSQAVLEADDKNEGDKQPDAVQLMTVHASKGLEFHHVYLIGLEQGLFPHVGRSGNEDEDEKAVSEERRLMYVAMTRARRKLRISCCGHRRMYGEFRANPPSQFLDEIPQQHLHALNEPQDEDGYSGHGSGSGYGSGYGARYGARSGGYGSSYGSGYGSGNRSERGARSWSKPPTGADASRLSSDGWKRAGVRKASDYLSSGGQSQSSGNGSSGFGFSKASRAVSAGGFSVGEQVVHEKFGRGRIEKITYPDKPEQTRIMIRFEGESQSKEFLLSFVSEKLSKA